MILGITPGPNQPADLESFLQLNAEELNDLAAGVSFVTVAGFLEPQVVHAYMVQFKTDMPAGNKLLNAICGSSENSVRFRIDSKLRLKRRYYYPPYAPEDQPSSKRLRFDVRGSTTPRLTADSVAASARELEAARSDRKRKTAVHTRAQKEGVQGYSVFINPSPQDKERYPKLKCLWKIGLDLQPYDTKHLRLCNFMPRLSELFYGGNDNFGMTGPVSFPPLYVRPSGVRSRQGAGMCP